MKPKDYTTSFTVDQSPEEVFDAVNNVRGRWSEEIDGSTDKLGAEFKFRYKDFHCRHPEDHGMGTGQESGMACIGSPTFVTNKTEWNGTDVVFEITKKGTKPNSALRTSAWFLPSNATVTVQAHGAFISTTLC